MRQIYVNKPFLLVYTLTIILQFPDTCFGTRVDSKVLDVGKELWRETLPLKMGSRFYQLQGLKPFTWYEVKISYPASIPASFSLELRTGDAELALRQNNRKLLNTEKLIFQTESLDQDEMYVLVTVEPEGAVAIPNVKERESIIFNIVCDELLWGIPRQAWGVVVLVLICMVLAFIIPSYLPSWLLLHTNQTPGSVNQRVSKTS